MRGNIHTIMKKELARFFGDKRIVITTILLPGILIYVMYSFMGRANSIMSEDDGNVPQAMVVNLPESINDVSKDADISFVSVENTDVEKYRQQISDEECSILAVFPEDFDESVENYLSSSGESAPNVEIYFNGVNDNSWQAYNEMTTLLNNYENSISNKFDVNSGDEIYNLASDKKESGSLFSSLLPMLLLIFLFSSCMAVAPEAIAGEKERGTIATLLVTPVKRSDIAIGKIFALVIIALLSGLSSTIGTLMSLPKLLGASSSSMSAQFYTISDYTLLAAVILSTVLIIITLIAIISAYAKTIKEAQTAVMPLMIIVILAGVSAQFGDHAKTAMYWYFVPLYNSVQCMKGIFGFDLVSINVAVTIIANILLSTVGVFILTKMFNNENVMFRK